MGRPCPLEYREGQAQVCGESCLGLFTCWHHALLLSHGRRCSEEAADTQSQIAQHPL